MSSLDSFKVFKDYIKRFVLEDQELQKLIYYPYSTCLDENNLANPFDIFSEETATDNENGVHGVLLFKRQSDIVMNAEMPLVLVSFENAKKSKEFSNIYIIFKIICKGNNIQELENGDSRIYSIQRKINDNFAMANVNGLGQVEENSFKELSINSNNDAMLLMYKAYSFNSNISTNKNFKKRMFGDNYAN